MGQGLTAAKMKDCRWLKPVLVGQFEFREWTPDNHLRHSRFVALSEVEWEAKCNLRRILSHSFSRIVQHSAARGIE